MQQFRAISQQFCSAELSTEPNPKFQFIIDLQSWIEAMIKDSFEIIMCLDANEGIDDQTGQFCPLEFTLDRPISGKGHDEKLATLIHTCGLCNPL
jgi:hypothetical protein